MKNFEGPYFDELSVGDVFDTAPALTLSEGKAAVHQSILGSRLRLPLDTHLSRKVSGTQLADPSFAWEVAIGQSTLVTRRVVANLFYRGLGFQRWPSIGDTLQTRTEVVGLRQTSSRPSGLAALRMTTTDQEDRVVLDFWRCAMLPLSDASVVTGKADDLSTIGSPANFAPLLEQVSGWDLAPHPASQPLSVGDSWELEAGDVVSNAPEIARLSLNLAHLHHDEYAQGSRLVYGGHTIGVASAQLTRTLPNLITVAGWHSCDHTGPVRESDTLVSHIEIEDISTSAPGVQSVSVRVKVFAKRKDAPNDQVLDWRLVALTR
jgi:acyl dehydratase